MNQISRRPLVLRFLAVVCALVASMTVWLPTQLVEVAHAAAYSGTFDFDPTDPSKVIGCTADACDGMSITIPSTNGGTAVTSIGIAAFDNLHLTAVSIPNSITDIGWGAFTSNLLTTVTIPNSVITIGRSAFEDNQLTTVLIPNSVVTIVDYAFTDNDLTTVTIGNSVTSIGPWAFWQNEITTLTIGNSVTTIGDNAFMDNQITDLTLPNSVTTLGQGVFQSNNISTLRLSNSLTEISNEAFNGNTLTSVTIPNSITSIGQASFGNNTITSISIPNSVTTLGNYAFTNNELTSVTIPRSITSFGTSVFSENMLTSIKFLGNRPSIRRWGSKIWSLRCVYFVTGKTGWPGNTINGITPTLEDDCDATDGGGYFTFQFLTPRQVAYNAGLHLVAASKVRVTILDSSSTICRVVDGQVRGIKSGVCRISVAVTAPDGTVERALLVVNFRK